MLPVDGANVSCSIRDDLAFIYQMTLLLWTMQTQFYCQGLASYPHNRWMFNIQKAKTTHG